MRTIETEFEIDTTSEGVNGSGVATTEPARPMAATPSPDEVSRVLGLDARPTKGRRVTRWLIGVAALALVAFAASRWIGSGKGEVAYRTAPVTRGSLSVTVTATGALAPTDQVEVGSELSGRVDAVYVDFNASVRAGQPLARLDTSKLDAQERQSSASVDAARARVLEAEASVTEAKVAATRTRELYAAELVSQSVLDTAEASLARAEASLASARAQVAQAEATLNAVETDLTKTVIRSPVDGVVLNRAVDPGQTVAASLQAPVLFTIAQDLRRMELHVDVDEADVSRVANGQQATFTVDAYPDRTFPATIREVRYASKTVQGVVTYEAVLEVDNAELLLRPGMTATADISVERIDDALLVPNAALRFQPTGATSPAQSSGGLLSMLLPRRPRRERPADAGNGGAGIKRVWTLSEGQPVPVRLTTGASDGVHTVITSGDVAEGLPLIVDVAANGASRP